MFFNISVCPLLQCTTDHSINNSHVYAIRVLFVCVTYKLSFIGQPDSERNTLIIRLLYVYITQNAYFLQMAGGGGRKIENNLL